MSGTILSVDALPREWLEPIELRDLITEVANDLYDFPDWESDEYSRGSELRRRIRGKYPPMW